MGRSALLVLATLAAAAGVALAPERATAQCRLCDAPTTARDGTDSSDSVALDIATRLDFDRLILLGNAGGSATMRPDGSRSVSGAVGDLSGRAMVGTGVIHGAPGRAIRITLPRRIELFSLGGGKVVIDDIVSDTADGARLDSTGALTFRFGGQLQVSGDAEGDYRGDVPITVEYL
jgi:hypothetical protein